MCAESDWTGVIRIGRSAVLPVTLLAVLLAGCGMPSAASAGAALDAATDDGPSTVLYEVTGPTKAGNITYVGAGQSMNIAQEQGAALPWSKTVEMSGSMNVATLSAQNAGSGDITCRITVDGEVVSEITSSGEYAIASCSSRAF